MTKEPVILERIYKATPGKIWQALTDPIEMKKWYFDIPDFKAEPGFKFRFYAGEEGGKQFLHICEVKEAIPDKKLSYTWSYDMDPAITLVSFELLPEGENTKLKLTHKGLDDFSADNPDLKKQNFVDGWTQILGTSLKSYLENKK